MKTGELEEDEKRKCFREAAEAGVRRGRETSLGGIQEPGGGVPEKRGWD